jgi:hypothetical protein
VLVTGAERFFLEGDLPGQSAEDAADAALGHPGACGNLPQGEALAPEAQEFLVGGRAQGQHPGPQLLGLGHLAGAGLVQRGQVFEVGGPPLLPLQGGLVVAVAADQAAARHGDEQGAQAGPVGELKGGLAQAVQQVDPDRLDDVT